MAKPGVKSSSSLSISLSIKEGAQDVGAIENAAKGTTKA